MRKLPMFDLDELDTRIVILVDQGLEPKSIAAECGCAVETVYMRLERPGVSAEILRRAQKELAKLAPKSVRELAKMALADAKTDAQKRIKLDALKTALSYGISPPKASDKPPGDKKDLGEYSVSELEQMLQEAKANAAQKARPVLDHAPSGAQQDNQVSDLFD